MSAIRTTRIVLVACLVGAPLGLTACSSSSSTPATSHHPGEPYLSRAGTGNATLPEVALPSAWSLVWHFDCTHPASRRPFVLTVTPSGGKATTVTDQTGLQGGGYRPFHASGNHTFAVTTTCGWQVLVGAAGTQSIPTTTRP